MKKGTINNLVKKVSFYLEIPRIKNCITLKCIIAGTQHCNRNKPESTDMSLFIQMISYPNDK